jgi:hypothetical protein
MSARPHDDIPPELSLSVFQNPYLTQYLDIYLIGSETLADTSVFCSVDDVSVGMYLADSDENVWKADYELEESGTISIYAMARDVSLNWADTTRDFSATLVLKSAGGLAMSPDGRMSVDIPGGCLRNDAFVLIGKDRTEVPGIAAVYKVSPPGLDLDGFVEISVSYDEDMGPAEHLTLVRLEDGAATQVVSYADRETKRVLAFVEDLGTYGLMWSPEGETPTYGAGDFTVLQNVPNPFAGTTAIAFVLPRAGRVSGDVIAIDGRLVARLCDCYMIPGRHSIEWDGRDSGGQAVASGVYFYTVRFGSEIITRKMVNLR